MALFCISTLNLFDEKGVCKATLATPYLVIIIMGRRDLDLEEDGGGVTNWKPEKVKITNPAYRRHWLTDTDKSTNTNTVSKKNLEKDPLLFNRPGVAGAVL